MQTKYPSFIFNNESFIIIPGHLFKKDDLKSRLNMMGVDVTLGTNGKVRIRRRRKPDEVRFRSMDDRI